MTDAVYYLNAYDGARYAIMRYEGRYAVPAAPIIGSGNDAGAAHVAWPSAFRRQNGQHIVYASRHISGKWLDVAKWTSADGKSFTWAGAVLSANSSEPYGIGPTQIYYDPSRPRPWLMVYARRNAEGTADRIDLADSADGQSWSRIGPVLAIDKPYEAQGVCPSHVMKLSDGQWALFYHAYRTLSEGVAVVAFAPSSAGPFSDKTLLMEPTLLSHNVTSGVPLTTTIEIDSEVRVGEPYVLRNIASSGMQVVWPRRQIGSIVYLDDPLLTSYGPAVLAHIARNKVDPSIVIELADGSFSGLWTGYGMIDGVTSEYTFQVQAPTISGPWTISKSDIPFESWNVGSRLSAENPTPLIEVP